MDKQKQIEEMENDIAVRMAMAKGVAGSMNNGVEGWLAEYLIEKGWEKIPEGAVVIDRNENPCLSCPVPTGEREIADCSTICGAVQLGIDWKNQCRVLVRDYNRLEKDYKNARKETAEKFAEMVSKAFLNLQCIDIDEWNWYQRKIDEICKEITEEKNNA